MRLQIRARDIKVTKALRAYVELRLGFALSRFGQQIDRVAVQLSNADERSAGLEKRCRIAVGLPRSVKVQETDADLFSAVARAARRMERAIAHAIEQERTQVPSRTQPWKEKRPKADAAMSPASRGAVLTARALALTRRYSSEPLHK